LRASRATASAVSWLVEEITAAVGCSRVTWLMRRPVRRSTPFMSETIGASVRATRGRTALRF
jgi:hypothetical protein